MSLTQCGCFYFVVHLRVYVFFASGHLKIYEFDNLNPSLNEIPIPTLIHSVPWPHGQILSSAPLGGALFVSATLSSNLLLIVGPNITPLLPLDRFERLIPGRCSVTLPVLGISYIIDPSDSSYKIAHPAYIHLPTLHELSEGFLSFPPPTLPAFSS